MGSIYPFFGLIGALAIPFVYRQRFRSASERAAVWLKPEGEGFIFHPFGKWARAYKISATVADLIKAKLTMRNRILYGAMLAAVVPSLILASLDPADFVQLRPYLSMARIAVVAIAIIGVCVWHRVAIRPLYADAPVSDLRIPSQEVRKKQAANTSWGMIVFTLIRVALFAGCLVWYGVSTHHPLIAALSLVLFIRAATTGRIIYFKLQPT